MSFPLIDVFITTYPKDHKRVEILRDSCISFYENTNMKNVRLTVCVDGFGFLPPHLVGQIAYKYDYLLCNKTNQGLGPTINHALTHIDAVNKYHEQRNETEQVSEFICMVQDDVLYKKDWLDVLVKYFLLFEKKENLGFASGHDAIEHATKKEIANISGQKIICKDWIRATNMFGRRSYWMSMFPIPGMDPETGRKRAKPDNGMGSGVDWWFLRNHPNSVCKTGKTNLVIPGLVTHFGHKDSTWLKRELPESEEDKKEISLYQNKKQKDAMIELVRLTEEYGGYDLELNSVENNPLIKK